ncbi:MAG: hypothetical protein ACOX8E_08740 [Ruminococcus sp.]|jgi:hypothetical protein
MSKKKKKKDHALRRELDTYARQGILLCLDGQPSTPKEIEKACSVAEKGTYMRDYIQNERGELEKLEFDLIKEE